MSSVWMWQFQRPSPPTTTIDSPMASHVDLKVSTASSGASSRYITSYRGPSIPAWSACPGPTGARADVGGDLRRLGQRPAVDDVQDGVEEEDETGPAGVDHARRP